LTEKLHNTELKKFYDSINNIEINKVFNTFKLIAPEQINKKYSNYNILEYAISKLDLNLVKNLSEQEIKCFTKDPHFLKSLA
ncbi:hypothetical protein U2060_15255, partial [Listeria monocytogenes]|uniref:hypothetical protein n=1 Tax=Listeria monocytogenes TaxID=1639 RepID=UPI002FDBC007